MATVLLDAADMKRTLSRMAHEILEANQVCAYFNYSNRLLNGLGVSTEGEALGLSPASSADLALTAHR